MLSVMICDGNPAFLQNLYDVNSAMLYDVNSADNTWRRDFAALDEADHVDLPPDVLATLRAMGYRLPARHPARAIPGLIEHLIEQIELRDPDCIEARRALAEWKSKPQLPHTP